MSSVHSDTPAAPRCAATTDRVGGVQRLLAAGGLIGALLASSCCLAPLALFSLGISGAWIGNLTGLAPYQPYFLAFALACLAGGYWLNRRSQRIACAAGESCAEPRRGLLVKACLLLAGLLIATALAVDLLGPLLFA
jgi:mercuric ion transport protein